MRRGIIKLGYEGLKEGLRLEDILGSSFNSYQM